LDQEKVTRVSLWFRKNVIELYDKWYQFLDIPSRTNSFYDLAQTDKSDVFQVGPFKDTYFSINLSNE